MSWPSAARFGFAQLAALRLRTGDEKVALLRHLDGIEAVMATHFGFEERQLVGLLDALDVEGLDKQALYGPIA